MHNFTDIVYTTRGLNRDIFQGKIMLKHVFYFTH